MMAAARVGHVNCAIWILGALFALLALMSGPSSAQNLESALSPGPLVRSHAKLEGQCSECHVRFDRAGQDGRCLACHKDVAQDIRARKRLHGKQVQQTCRSCHVDHRGLDMVIAPLDTKTFDHAKTDYLLRGKHVGPECKACHTAGKKYREAPQDCLSCHLKDDKHKGTLGKDCANCHVEQGWQETKFDHSKTNFPLTGKHIPAKCDSCHKTKVYNDVPSTCVGCHRKEDKHKGRYGEKCETCHGTKSWTSISFRHDTDTRYPLRGKHATTKCDSCHTGHLYRDKLGTDCIDCHRKDDKHKGSLGVACLNCHVERSWKEVGKFDHDTSSFPLRGGHIKAECKSCHTTPVYKDTPSDCLACHRKDDKHEGTLGTTCGDCHTDRDWKATRFDHSRTRFRLVDGHAVPPLKCDACHRDMRAFRPTARDCLSCHRKDDKHEGQLGERCDSCHIERGWRITRFDHNRARFALVGAHVKVECKSCHSTPRYRDAPRDCVGCHRKDDQHKATLGSKCESCHNQRDWRLWSFDHTRQTKYALEGSHAKVSCIACHQKPAPTGRAIAELDRTCNSCHRRDDIHDGAFGTRCDQCHTVTRWKQVTNRARTSRATTGPMAGQIKQGVAS
jgi:hypothetical protein